MRSRSLKTLTAGIAALATLLLIDGVAVAEVQSLSASPNSAAPGTEVTISGTTTCPGTVVNLYFSDNDGPVLIGSGTADAVTGDFSAPGVIPVGAPLGLFAVGAQCNDGSPTMYRAFLVTAPPTTTTTTTTTTVAPTTSTTSTTSTTTTTAPDGPAVSPSGDARGERAGRPLSLVG